MKSIFYPQFGLRHESVYDGPLLKSKTHSRQVIISGRGEV